VFPSPKLLRTLCAASAISTGAFGILEVVRANWFTAACLLAVAVLSAEGALRGPARFRFGLTVSVLAVFWTVLAVEAAARGAWFDAVSGVVLAACACAFWVAPWLEHRGGHG
jgi:hypothetical protein